MTRPPPWPLNVQPSCRRHNGPPESPQTGRRRSSYPESKDCSFVFQGRATGCLDRFPVGLAPAPALIPTQPAGHGFTAPSASGRAGSRTGLPHCTPQRHGGVDEARDWLRLPESKGYPGIDERLSPLFLRHSPPSFRSSPPSGVDQDWPDPFPAGDGEQYRPAKNANKRRDNFGNNHNMLATLWKPNHAPRTVWPGFPHAVKMWTGKLC